MSFPKPNSWKLEPRYEESLVQLAAARQALANLGLPVELESRESLSDAELAERLRFAGIPFAVREQIQPTQTTNLLPVVAPMDGVIVDRQTVVGEVVDLKTMLFEIADPSHYWLEFNIPLESASLVRLGQTVRFHPDGSERECESKIWWLSTSVDKQTRTLPARAMIANLDGSLKNEMFGSVDVVLREDSQAVVVPSAAIQRDGNCFIVFVRDKDFLRSNTSPKYFHVRSVRVGVADGDDSEIIAGVVPGEVVATIGSDVLRGQLLKSGLGDGCCQ